MRKDKKFKLTYKMEGKVYQETYSTRYDADKAIRFINYYNDVEFIRLEEVR